ncbi:hypothetical protein MCOR14_010144 [Pyricularia oryzae]|nr:hypothetical protein MCOR19_001528 [Pyricularia oryzae]KAI6418508.1 hypothetical protein MCOR24_005389 [Pyricularia oryzae]KAI6452810.1 hypothetical protein MCOR22_000591 [Pyricularia oryzae]KAI6468620.1 hypothetical protein MCOR15_002048 [Pyricularia oryzae]KAI6469139.1 hypothetical protein MCOR18_009304 [Pyricularia oryzae]
MLFLKTLLLLLPVACLAEMTTEFPPTRVEEPAADCSNSGTCASHTSFSKQLEEYRVVGWNFISRGSAEQKWRGSIARGYIYTNCKVGIEFLSMQVNDTSKPNLVNLGKNTDSSNVSISGTQTFPV